MYYTDGSGDYGAYDLKERIVARAKEFEELVAQAGTFGEVADGFIGEAEGVIAAEQAALNSAIGNALSEWNGAADDASNALSDEIAAKIAHMDDVIAEKTDAINEVIDTLTEDFIIIFWETVEEIYNQVNYYERQGLIWKALYQKDQFLAEVSAIRDWLLAGLAETREQLVSELNAERSGFASFVGENRNGLVADTNGMKAEMAAGIAENRQSMEDN